jgi:signal transduction histidine kinase/ligand-binding sensor domain-containing protein
MGPASAAEPAPLRFSRQSWDSRAGLPAGIIRGLVRAADGSIAVGSDRGLVRFDGLRGWPVPLERPRDDVPTIARLLAVGDTLVVLLRDGGIVTLHGGRQRYLGAAAARVAAAGGGCEATSLCQDDRGQVWVALGDGSVGRFAGAIPGSGAETGSDPEVVWHERVFGEAADGQAEVLTDESGTVWLAGGGGLFARRGDESAFRRVAAIPMGSVRLARRRAGGLWIQAGWAVGSCDGDGYRRLATAPAGNVAALHEDEAGRLWLGTSRAGLFHGDARGGLVFRQAPTGGRGVHAILDDGPRGIWAGTTAGLDHVHPSVVWLGAATLRQPVSLAIADGHLWSVTASGELVVHRDAASGSTAITGPPEIFTAAAGWPAARATCVAAADTGVWVGTKEDGLFRAWCGDGEKPATCERVAVPAAIEATGIEAVLAAGDCVWAATEGAVAVRRDGTWAVLPAADGRLRLLATDPGGNAWATTAAGHVVRLRVPIGDDGLAAGTIVARRVTSAPLAPEATITAICPIDAGVAWVAVKDVGLFRIAEGEVTTVGSEQGLESIHVIAAMVDRRNRLWCVCGRRLMVIGLDSLAAAADGGEACRPIMIDGTADGPFPDTIGGFLPAAARDRLGRLWLASHDRLVVCDPAAVDRASPAALPRVEQISVDGRVVRGGPGTGGFGRPATEQLSLPAEPRLVEIVLAWPWLGDPPVGGLEHRLVGAVDDWTATPADGRLRFSRLGAGSHSLQLRSIDGQGRRTALIEPVRLDVPPRWWERPWVRAGFVAAVAAAAALAGLGIASWRGRRKFERLAREAAVERERTRIARDMHDEVGTSLTQVALLAELALGDAEPAAAAERLGEVARISRQTVASLDELVWSVNPVNDTLAGLLDHLAQCVLDGLSPLGITCRIELPESPPPAATPADFRRHALLMVKEACGNVAKHADAGEAWFTAAVRPGWLQLRLADDGRGRPADLVPGQGIANMRRRAEALGGTCMIEDRPGGGTVVTFEVPLPRAGREA